MSRSYEKRGFPCFKWKKLDFPKALGGWGLKNIFHFSKALATKSVWRLIKGKGLWCQETLQKYIFLESIDDWIRRPRKSMHNVSIIWKDLILAFPLANDGLVWKVRNGTQVHLGVDPWVGSGMDHKLHEHMD
jgi:hypothetical protein